MNALRPLVILTFASLLFAQEPPPPDRGIRAMREIVRGDTGKWNDSPILQVIPPPANKPKETNLDAWADQLLENPPTPRAGEEVWLLFRSRQLDDNDRVWVEKVEREGNAITVTMHEAIWQGNYFKTFTYYEVMAVNLGMLPEGDYSVNWIVQPLEFKQFDGDGRPFARNGKPRNWPKDETAGKEEAVEIPLTFSVKYRPSRG